MTAEAKHVIRGRDIDGGPHGQGERRLFSWKSASAAAAVTLAAAATFNSLRARQAEARNPPIGRFLTIDGVRLHYIERGTGSPIVLLHGNGAMAADWEASGVIDGLAADHRVIAFDRPGFGHTPRPRTRLWTPKAQAAFFAKAMRQLDLKHALVVGHSWGVLPTIALALDHRELVSGLVLMSGVFYPEIRTDILTSLPSALPGPGHVMCHTITPLVAAATSPMQTKSVFRP
ncbi:MAG TPA: alpha/beta hydrolase, partial [Herpetosiphonaceae bacterium]|nr:alpha/beta hydrolase [Herpetosiphonaceae bacterium]